jgi:hypothetical protein
MDREATKAAMMHEIEQMPEDQRQFARVGLSMLDKMTATMKLTPNGEAIFQVSLGQSAEAEARRGTWVQQGTDVVLTNPEGKSMRCALSGVTMTCDEKHSSGTTRMVFRAQQAH